LADPEPHEPKAEVFISYSRVDRTFAVRLAEVLKAHGFKPLLDLEDILPSEAWWAQRGEGISRLTVR
jgi:hypothetical protein